MKKIALLLTVLAVVLVAGYFYINTAVKDAVEQQGSRILGTPVRLESSSILPFSGTGNLTKLAVANPEGFNGDAFRLTSLDISIDVMSLFSDIVVIKEIIITEPFIHYEVIGKGSNIKTLQKNAAREDAGSTGQDTSSSSGDKKKRFIIEHLYIKNGHVLLNASLMGQNNQQQLALPDIYVKDIGRDRRGATSKEVVDEVLASVNNGLGDLNKDLVKGQLNNVTGKIKGLFNRGEEPAQ